MDSEVIVIGGGLSGLSAAKWLHDAGVSVIVLEARDRLGGRTFTKKDPKIQYVDLGGTYVGPTQNRLLRLTKELGIENCKVNEVEDLLHYKNGRRTRFPHDDLPILPNIFVDMDLVSILHLIEEMAKEIPSDCPWNAPHAEEWDTMTFKEFLHKKCWTQGAIDFCTRFIGIVIASEPYEASLLGFLWYLKQCGGTKRLFSTTNGAQERKFVGGCQQVSEKIAERLGSEAVKKSSPVIGINQESRDIVLVKTLDGKEYKTKNVILACAPILHMKIHFTPPLPPLRNQLIQRVPVGSVIKFVIYYKTTFWREKGLCGSFVIEGGEDHPCFFTLDDTKHDGSFPAIIGFIAADKCRRIFHLSPEERRDRIAKSLSEATGFPEALEPLHYEEKNWMEEQYSGGCYTAMYPPGFFTRYGRALREPIDRLYFAGTETATEWSGYMEGAVEAGERAAREILSKMAKISPSQIWLKEPQSEDVVPLPFPKPFVERFAPSVPTFLTIVTLLAISIGVIILCTTI